MDDWASDRLSDFLMFSPETYFRQFELYNAAIWPAQIFALALGGACLWLMRRPGAAPERVIPALLAAAWLWVAWGSLYTRHATINWGAGYLAGAFVLQGVLLLLVGIVGKKVEFDSPIQRAQKAGIAIFLFALIPLASLPGGPGKRPRSSPSRPTRRWPRPSVSCWPRVTFAGNSWSYPPFGAPSRAPPGSQWRPRIFGSCPWWVCCQSASPSPPPSTSVAPPNPNRREPKMEALLRDRGFPVPEGNE